MWLAPKLLIKTPRVLSTQVTVGFANKGSRTIWLFGVFCFSGSAVLVYQTVWQTGAARDLRDRFGEREGRRHRVRAGPKDGVAEFR